MNPTLNATHISGMSHQRLKQELTRRGLSTLGLKPELLERLETAGEMLEGGRVSRKAGDTA